MKVCKVYGNERTGTIERLVFTTEFVVQTEVNVKLAMLLAMRKILEAEIDKIIHRNGKKPQMGFQKKR